jgi:hypothetical protein
MKKYKVYCPEYCDKNPECPACGGKGYNIVIFKNGKRIK